MKSTIVLILIWVPVLALCTWVFVMGLSFLPSLPKPQQCLSWSEEYYWSHWEGSKVFVGNDLDRATAMAAGKPLGVEARCTGWGTKEQNHG